MKSGKVIDLRGGKRVEAPRPRSNTPAPHHRDRPVSPIRVRRRRKRAIMALTVAVLVAAAIYGVHWMSYLPRLTVRVMEVRGAERIDPSLIRSYVESVINDGSYHFLSRANIFLYPRHLAEKGIVASFPRVSAAAITRDGPIGQDLRVTIAERTSYARWCASSDEVNCYTMDELGYIFSESASSTDPRAAQPYRFTGGVDATTTVIGQTFAPGHLPGIIALLKLLVQNAELTPMSVNVEDDQDFSVMFAEGFFLKASYGSDAYALARNIQLVLGSNALKDQQENLEYIDLRFGNRVYYKLKGQEQAAV